MKRTEMNALAETLGIDPKKFKNKQLLWEEIEKQKKASQRSEGRCVKGARCYNQTDPCTLEPVDEISDLVEWNQTIRNKVYHFGASRASLTQLLKNRETPVILPWAIDFCSGVEAVEDSEWYKRTFDIRFIQFEESTTEEFGNLSEAPKMNQFLFEIEELSGDNTYLYGTLVNRVIRANRRQIYERVSGSMMRVMYLLNDNPVQRDIFYTYCYVVYSSLSFHLKKKEDHLLYLLDILRTYAIVAGSFSQFVINMIFMDL
jgi:hypothetical protein